MERLVSACFIEVALQIILKVKYLGALHFFIFLELEHFLYVAPRERKSMMGRGYKVKKNN